MRLNPFYLDELPGEGLELYNYNQSCKMYLNWTVRNLQCSSTHTTAIHSPTDHDDHLTWPTPPPSAGELHPHRRNLQYSPQLTDRPPTKAGCAPLSFNCYHCLVQPMKPTHTADLHFVLSADLNLPPQLTADFTPAIQPNDTQIRA